MAAFQKPGKLVLVHWLDAHADGSWTDASGVGTKPEKVQSVGWVIRHDKRGISLCADMGSEKRAIKGDVNRTMVIPAGMIVKVWHLAY